MLVDNQFPEYSDYGIPEKLDRFSETERAQALYKMFRIQNVLCDIANNAEELSVGVLDRIRKSDLVVLDYHLSNTDHTDASEAIRILAQLADSKHFNLVVVYTKQTDLNAVWIEIATNLHGGWIKPLEVFKESEDLFAVWDDLKNERKLPSISMELLKSEILKTRMARDEKEGTFSLCIFQRISQKKCRPFLECPNKRGKH